MSWVDEDRAQGQSNENFQLIAVKGFELKKYLLGIEISTVLSWRKLLKKFGSVVLKCLLLLHQLVSEVVMPRLIWDAHSILLGHRTISLSFSISTRLPSFTQIRAAMTQR